MSIRNVSIDVRSAAEHTSRTQKAQARATKQGSISTKLIFKVMIMAEMMSVDREEVYRLRPGVSTI